MKSLLSYLMHPAVVKYFYRKYQWENSHLLLPLQDMQETNTNLIKFISCTLNIYIFICNVHIYNIKMYVNSKKIKNKRNAYYSLMGTSILIKTPKRGWLNANFKKSERLMNVPLLRYRGFRSKPYTDSGCEIKAAKRKLKVISKKETI